MIRATALGSDLTIPTLRADDVNAENRPLSPFMIYRWKISNTLSILHRATGAALFLGAVVLVGWLYGIAGGPDQFATFTGYFDGVIGDILIAGWVFCFYFHFANGIRHLFWDAGRGFEPATARLSGKL